MTNNYAAIVRENIDRFYHRLPDNVQGRMGARLDGRVICFRAFGTNCAFSPEGIRLDNVPEEGVLGILVSLYALHAEADVAVAEPYRAFKELPHSMPYAGAFATHTEQVLVSHCHKIEETALGIAAKLDGGKAPENLGGDFSFVVRPLPKISLCYLFYRADEDFPAAATCLFSANAHRFLPTDALADVGEYTSKKILDLV